MSVIYINSYQFAAPAGATDPYFSNVSLLLHGDGTNGSTTIVDSSPSPKTVTPVGDAQISTARSKFGGASMDFDGSGDYLSVTDQTMAFGTEEFTIEFWMHVLSTANLEGMISCGNGGSTSWQISGGTNLVFRLGSDVLSTTFPSLSTWHHFALTRDGSNAAKMFLNGVNVSSTSITNNFSDNNLRIGVNRSNAHYYHGYIDDLRITKGIARYTSNFTPPTAPFPDS